MVEKALLKRVCGFRYDERISQRGDDGLVLVKLVRKKLPPDTTAQIFRLFNRAPNRWKRNIAV